MDSSLSLLRITYCVLIFCCVKSKARPGLLSLTSVGARDVFVLFGSEWQENADAAWSKMREMVRVGELAELENWIDDDFEYIRQRATHTYESGDWMSVHRDLGPLGSRDLPSSVHINVEVSSVQKNGTRALCALLRIAGDTLRSATNVDQFSISTFFPPDSKDNVFQKKEPTDELSAIEIDCAQDPVSTYRGGIGTRHRTLRKCVNELARHPKLTHWFTTAPEHIAQFAKTLKKIMFLPFGLPVTFRPYMQGNVFTNFSTGSYQSTHEPSLTTIDPSKKRRPLVSVLPNDMIARGWLKHFPEHFVFVLPEHSESLWPSHIAQSPFLALAKDSQRFAVLALALGVVPVLHVGSSSLRLLHDLPHALVRSKHLEAHLLLQANTAILGNSTSFFNWQTLTKKFWIQQLLGEDDSETLAFNKN